MPDCKEISYCLCCHEGNLRTILDLGNQSPANNYNVSDKFPLRLNVCMDCSHAQLSHSVDPDILFEDYPYMSGVSETMKEYYRKFAKDIQAFGNYKPSVHTDVSVYEIACNDGSQLDAFKELGFKTFGIDPAKNLFSAAKEKGHDIDCAYFPEGIRNINKTFDIIIAQNVLAHTVMPMSFLEGCKEIMDDQSILVIQTSQANMIKNHQFDTIYHEHISFFNKRSISKLFNKCDMQVADYKFLPDIHGGSDLYILKKMPNISILDYSEFSNRSYKFAKNLKDHFDSIKKRHAVICYGAAAKMINLIRFTGIKPDFIVDDTPTKMGKHVDGIPIVSGTSAEFMALPEGTYIIPVWNFHDEIKAKVEKEQPGKFHFLKYIPIIE